MISDDTEHALFVVQSLLAHPASPDAFARRLAWCLRGWMAGLPAGVGLATARACLRLWLGFPPSRSGVFSAGNGPAMRVAPLGAFFALEPDDLDRYVAAATCLTHTDPKALVGARAVALTAAWIARDNLAARPPASAFVEQLRAAAPGDPEWMRLMTSVRDALDAGAAVPEYAAAIGQAKGVSGYIYHTVPVALFAWHRHFGDFESTLSSVLDCGGDADTTGAIVGALAGATVGEKGIPPDWLGGIWEWPRSVRVMRDMADRLAHLRESGTSRGPVPHFWPGIPPRNAFFLLIVLLHGFRRLLPPY